MQLAYSDYLTNTVFGPFGGINFPDNPASGYVGVRFASVGGDTVFGWIGVSIEGDVTNANFANAAITVNGFAYATDGTPLRAGVTEIPEPSSLGLLALGVAGLVIRRCRKQGAEASAALSD